MDNTSCIISEDYSNFVNIEDIIPNVIVDMRYFSSNNFVGEKIDGYLDNCALLTKDAANYLRGASDQFLKDGYRIKIFDAYRPYKALVHFKRWLNNDDNKMKDMFYKDLSKKELIEKDYISLLSSHTRGSTVDITLVDIKTNEEIDMGCNFDNFGKIAHYDYKNLTKEQLNNRKYLRSVMEKYNFKPLNNEWWHFTLVNEPYINTYFNFPVEKIK